MIKHTNLKIFKIHEFNNFLAVFKAKNNKVAKNNKQMNINKILTNHSEDFDLNLKLILIFK